jgi:hypothetical protein
MTPIEIARELELLRPFLKELLVMDHARRRLKLGPAFKERVSPDQTIDNIIGGVLAGTCYTHQSSFSPSGCHSSSAPSI